MNDMKRLFLYFFFLFVFAAVSLFATGPAGVKAQTRQAATAVKYASVPLGGSGVNIRSAPSTSSEVLHTAPPGYPLVIQQSREEWFLVEDYRRRRGWVFASLLTEPLTVIINVARGNLRSLPDLSGEVVATLDEGTLLLIGETMGEWLRVSDPSGLIGWVHQDIVWPTGKVTASSPGAVMKETAPAGEAAPPDQPVAPVSPKKDRKASAKVAAPPRPSVSREEGYRLGPRDVISVNVFAGGEKQISEDVSVAADGQITLPLFGAMQAAGLTLG
jgi:SH3-like domain-containing protein